MAAIWSHATVVVTGKYLLKPHTNTTRYWAYPYTNYAPIFLIKKSSKMSQKNKGYARVEFRANLEKIKELTKQGYTKKAIYEQLHGEGKVSMTYIHFCRFDPYTGQSLRSRNSSPAITGTPAVRTVSALPVPLRGDGPHAGQSDNDSKFSFKKKVTQEDLETDLV